MSQRRKKKNQDKVANYNIPSVPEDKLIEIHAEAYYRALKWIEEDKIKEETEADLSCNSNYKWYDNVLLFLNFIFFPWKISKRFKINDRIYDSILVLIVSMILEVIGFIMWGIGGIVLIYSIVQKIQGIIQIDIMLIKMALGIVSILLGSMLVLAAEQFSNEKDSNKIYAYSASIIALISCIVSVIALFSAK